MARRLAVVSVATLVAFSAAASARPWINITPVSGPTCVVQGGPVAYGAGYVTFAAGKVGTIVLNCEFNERDIFAFQDSNSGLPVYGEFTYRDSTGTGLSASVSARVITNCLVAGDPVTVAPLISSNESADTGRTTHISAAPVTTLGYYGPDSYVQIILKRTLTTETVEFHTLMFVG